MKSAPMIVGAALFIAGLVAGHLYRPKPGFQIVNSRLPVRFEASTGKAWVLYGSQWKPVKEYDPDDLDLRPVTSPSAQQP
jgi:hypothetical protein